MSDVQPGSNPEFPKSRVYGNLPHPVKLTFYHCSASASPPSSASASARRALPTSTPPEATGTSAPPRSPDGYAARVRRDIAAGPLPTTVSHRSSLASETLLDQSHGRGFRDGASARAPSSPAPVARGAGLRRPSARSPPTGHRSRRRAGPASPDPPPR